MEICFQWESFRFLDFEKVMYGNFKLWADHMEPGRIAFFKGITGF